MKTIELSKEYRRLSLLDEKDQVHFKRLLKGEGSTSCFYGPYLCIIPIHADSILVCDGFRIENHQIVFSKADGKSYLVFREKKIPSSEFATSYYQVSAGFFSPFEYVCLKRIYPKHI